MTAVINREKKYGLAIFELLTEELVSLPNKVICCRMVKEWLTLINVP